MTTCIQNYLISKESALKIAELQRQLESVIKHEKSRLRQQFPDAKVLDLGQADAKIELVAWSPVHLKLTTTQLNLQRIAYGVNGTTTADLPTA